MSLHEQKLCVLTTGGKMSMSEFQPGGIKMKVVAKNCLSVKKIFKVVRKKSN